MDYAYLAYGVDFDPVPMVDTIALSFPKTMTVLGSIDYRILEADNQTFLDRKDFLHEAAALLRQRDAHAGLGTDASFSFFPYGSKCRPRHQTATLSSACAKGPGIVDAPRWLPR